MSEGKQYRNRKFINWPEYNRALKHRGLVAFRFDRDITKVWFHEKSGPTGHGLKQDIQRREAASA